MFLRRARSLPPSPYPPEPCMSLKSAARSAQRRGWQTARLAIGAGLLCLLRQPSHARQGGASPVTQRSINEMAAGVEQARRTLLDDTHLRRPGEDLSAYLRRIALPLAAETKQQYVGRVGAYVAALAQSVDATRAGRRMPVLRDTDAFNQEQWTRAVRALQILPARVFKTQAAWKRVQAGYDVHGSSASNVPLITQTQLAVQLEQTVQVVIASDDALHNAKP